MPPANYHPLAAQQEPYKKTKRKKSLTLNEKCLRVFGKKSREWMLTRKKWQDRQSKRTKAEEKKKERRQERENKWQHWDFRNGWRTSNIPGLPSFAYTQTKSNWKNNRGQTRQSSILHNPRNVCTFQVTIRWHIFPTKKSKTISAPNGLWGGNKLERSVWRSCLDDWTSRHKCKTWDWDWEINMTDGSCSAPSQP